MYKVMKLKRVRKAGQVACFTVKRNACKVQQENLKIEGRIDVKII